MLWKGSIFKGCEFPRVLLKKIGGMARLVSSENFQRHVNSNAIVAYSASGTGFEESMRVLDCGGGDETINELFIYGCVKRALNITCEQKYVRRVSCLKSTLRGCPVDLEEYVENYIKWVCEEKL